MKRFLLYTLYFVLGCLVGREIKNFFTAPVTIRWTVPAPVTDCSRDPDTDCLDTAHLEDRWTRS